MYDNTINGEATMSGGEGTLLANRYRVIRPLGQGGMRSVWLAEDTQLDNREVAIKMLPSILVSNKRAYNQLKSEALVSLKLTHPNIATVRAFEENNGNPFLVVDYIDGITLDDYLLEKCDAGRAASMRPPHPGGLSESEVIRLLTPIADALDYAHSKGVVHRDIKPGNVMIAKDGTPYILDFGIAREIQETMTRVTGKLSSGTLMYMSPEQLHGAAPKASQDVYSFAAMAYECLMGKPPFSRGQIEYQIEHDSPAPIDPQFAKCGSGIMAGLAKNPEDRPTNCAAVLTRSVASDSGRASSMRPPQNGMASDGGRARAPRIAPASQLASLGGYPREPRRWGMTVASFLVIAAVCGAGYVWYQGQQDALSKQAKIARLAEEKKALETEKAEAAAKREQEVLAAAEAAREEKEKIEAKKARVAEETLVGKWSCSIEYGVGDSAVCVRHYNYEFKGDGSFVCEWKNVPSHTNVTCTVFERGVWSLAGNRLCLSYSSSRTSHSTRGEFANNCPSPQTFIVTWMENGSVGIRKDVDELRKIFVTRKCSEVNVFYDVNGRLNLRGRCLDGSRFSFFETPMTIHRQETTD